MHLTGLGYLGHSRSPIAGVVRPFAFAAIRRTMARRNAWLLAENGDDVARMVARGAAVPGRTAVVPGAGIDPVAFPELPAPMNAPPRAAFVGRMLQSKGVEVLVEAHGRLQARGVKLEVALYGAADPGSRQAIAESTLAQWNGQAGVRWYGQTGDVTGVWRHADIAVVPSLAGEGMPRAMLEAASCGRPLVVSDVPGCRHFVRHGIDGLVVPPGDAEALARELGRLATEPQLRSQLGAAARRRVLEGYTEQVVRARIRKVYADALAA
jgi:glycosyltransferase involved in cell wall biosynthesis